MESHPVKDSFLSRTKSSKSFDIDCFYYQNTTSSVKPDNELIKGYVKLLDVRKTILSLLCRQQVAVYVNKLRTESN